MRVFTGLTLFLALHSLLPVCAERPPRGFLQGPYLQLSAGARSAADDTNLVTNTNVGRNIEPMFGFHFGWHIIDSAGIDFSGHYTSLGTGVSQQHLITSRIDALWNPLLTPLVTSDRVRVLPFVLGGLTGQLNILPSADQTVAPRLSQWSVGPNVGAGIGVLTFHDQIFISARGVVDYLYRPSVQQTLSGVDTTIYSGGWNIQWNTMLGLGVHF